MGKRGPKKTPTKILELRGSWRAKDRNDMGIDDVAPECPDDLGDIARKHWEDIVPEMVKIGIIASFDWPKLAEMCEVWEQMQTIKGVAKLPERKRDDGKKETNPYFNAMIKLRTLYDRISSEFGMGPSNRAGIGNVQRDTQDSKARFFKKEA